MISKLNSEQISYLEEVFKSICESLDITKTQYDALKASYNAVGEHLMKDATFAGCKTVVTPQGSFRLGTIIKPVSEDGDIDVDLVFRVVDKEYYWTQKIIKDLVGESLRNSSRYGSMVDKKEGKRCWTLLYRKNSKDINERYHMDILPCVAEKEHETEFRSQAASNFDNSRIGKLSIRITDTRHPDYCTSTNISDWYISNPDGYALWFADRCKLAINCREIPSAKILSLDEYNPNKCTLQRIIQLLKRHRDIMFQYDDENKPISIIITTLASKAYKGETDILKGLANVVMTMENYIEPNNRISNPVMPEENFADKWVKEPIKKKKFYDWLHKAKDDINTIVNSTGIQLWKNLEKIFGESLSQKVKSDMTIKFNEDKNNGKLKMASTGIAATGAISLNAANTFYGKQ